MKLFKLLFILIVVSLSIISVFKREQIINIIKTRIGKEEKVKWKPTDEYIKNLNSYKPKLFLDQEYGKWVNEKDKQFRLVKELEIGAEDDENYRFFLPLDIEVDEFGDLYLLDSGHQRIQIFDQDGNFLRTIDKNKGFPPVAVDISINTDGIIAVAEKQKKEIYLFRDSGAFLESFSLSYDPFKVKALNDEFLVIGIGKYFLIHRYSEDGERISAFCPLLQRNESESIIRIFNEASFDSDYRGSIYLSYEYPYKIIKFNNENIPVLAFSRRLPDDIPPPIIDDATQGKEFTAKKRTISMEIKISQDGNIYNLIRGTETTRGNRIDKFDSEGNYLQTFYLSLPVDDFAISGTDYIWCLLGRPENKIIKYKIEKIAP